MSELQDAFKEFADAVKGKISGMEDRIRQLEERPPERVIEKETETPAKRGPGRPRKNETKEGGDNAE